MIRRMQEFDDAEDLGRDPELMVALATLDPASWDPHYWSRFRRWVMSGAAAELSRRRIAASLTVGDVVESWARALVPTAALVAALAGFLLLRGESPSDWPPIAVEEILISEVEGEPLPFDVAGLTFAAEIF